MELRSDSYIVAAAGASVKEVAGAKLAEPSANGDATAVVVSEAAEATDKAAVLKAVSSNFSLNWEGVSYTIPPKKAGKPATKILDNVSGCVQPGEMMCVMGTSGSGKTSLLNVLSGRHVGTGVVNGHILANHRPRGPRFRRTMAYVEQDDLMLSYLTVRETLHFQAQLRLPKTMSREQKIARAEEVLAKLGLTDCADTFIGNPMMRGVSGGERKRTSIGIDLITGPRILLLDEPTSGLDSYTAFHIMETVRSLALEGTAIVCSIHQPREKIFHLFDKLLLLSKGRTSYYGPRAEVSAFMHGLGLDCNRDGDNLADFLLDVTTVDTRSPELRSSTEEVGERIHAGYEASAYRAASRAESAASLAQLASTSGSPADDAGAEWSLSYAAEFALLARRALLNYRRNKRVTVAVVMQAIVQSLIAGLLFYQTPNTQSGLRDRQGAMFFMVLSNSFQAISLAQFVFQEEKLVFNRDRDSGAYRVSTYFLSKTVAELPIQLIGPLAYIIVAYWMIGLNPGAEQFFFAVLVIEFCCFAAAGLGQFISAAAPNLQVAQILAPVLIILLMLFGGFYVNVENIPGWLVWIEVFSFIKYAYAGLIVNEFAGATDFECEQNTYCLGNGTQVLEQQGMIGINKWWELGKLLLLMAGFRATAYVALRWMNRVKLRLSIAPPEDEKKQA